MLQVLGSTRQQACFTVRCKQVQVEGLVPTAAGQLCCWLVWVSCGHMAAYLPDELDRQSCAAHAVYQQGLQCMCTCGMRVYKRHTAGHQSAHSVLY